MRNSAFPALVVGAMIVTFAILALTTLQVLVVSRQPGDYGELSHVIPQTQVVRVQREPAHTRGSESTPDRGSGDTSSVSEIGLSTE